MHNLIVDPLIGVRMLDGTPGVMSLPEVYAALVGDRVAAFPALRPHQQHAWHAFLAQLGAIALHRAGCETLPDTAPAWGTLLRRLTSTFDRDEPWRLIVEAPTQPAFMQCPVSGGGGAYRHIRTTPDDLDLLVTAKNHDMKRAVAARNSPDDWVFALVNVQTMAPFRGGGNYGSARMNGGFAARPCLGLVPAGGGLGAHLVHDVQRMLATRGALLDRYPFEPDHGLALLWLHRWDGAQALDLSSLDPYFIEICRRIRLQATGAGIVARAEPSRKPRVDAKALHGDVGDFWTPVNVDDDGSRAFSLSAAGLRYDRLTALLFDFRHPPAMKVAPAESRRWRLVARGVAGGRGKTQGYHERTDVVLAAETVAALQGSDRSDELARLAETQVREITEVVLALKYSVTVASTGGQGPDLQGRAIRARADSYGRRLDAVADTRFFGALEARFLARDRATAASRRLDFVCGLLDAAERLLGEASASVPCPTIFRLRARTQAARSFRHRLRRPESIFSDQPEIWASREQPLPRAAQDSEARPPLLDVPGLARAIATRAPDVVAALERRPVVARGLPHYQTLAKYAPARLTDVDRWDLLIQATAILTGRRHSSTPSAYNPARSLGAALFDAGVSELSLARLLTTSPAHRRDQVIRVCRRLSITNHTGCDLRPLARFILDGNDATAQQINREYYGAAGVARLKLKEASS